MAALPLRSELARIGQLQAHLPGVVSALIGVAALAAVTLSELWPASEHVDAMAHEGAHATVGGAFGRRVTGVWLYRDGTGKPDWTLHGDPVTSSPESPGIWARAGSGSAQRN